LLPSPVDELELPEDLLDDVSPEVDVLDPDPSLPDFPLVEPDESPELSLLDDEVSPVEASSFFAAVGFDDERLSVL
jgi:hypothetical protein